MYLKVLSMKQFSITTKTASCFNAASFRDERRAFMFGKRNENDEECQSESK